MRSLTPRTRTECTPLRLMVSARSVFMWMRQDDIGRIHKEAKMKQVIGLETTYTGNEHPYLVGYRVKVIAVLKGAARPDFDPDRPGI